MKQLVALVGCAVFLMGLSGCRSANPGVDVVVEGGGEFPQALVGRWQADKNQWEFVFEPDGTISSAVIDSGFIRVVPSRGTATVPTRMGGKAVYKLGRWTVSYSASSRELAVEVVVDFFHIDMGADWLEGNSTDLFAGPVSEDWQQWRAEWISFPKYIAFTPEPGELPVDPLDTVTELVFKKVAGQAN
ncbi:MAG TPA: hypothetical protein VMW16_16690 [Sedimentisphaerales bacterium]|nr:hypothetical protein [Sedimentisphaerales bacterium]